jgi:hypothetical protein
MANPNVFALRDSDLNPFLFSRVGTELNGSELTILSILARLGEDPWSEAGRLSKLPKVAATDWLTDRIGRMPLITRDLGEAAATAARLVLLLPTGTTRTLGAIADAQVAAQVGATKMPNWAILGLLLVALALIFVAGSRHFSAPGTAPDHAIQQDQ